MCRNGSAARAPWQLWSVDVNSGSEKLVGNVDVPAAAGTVQGFSLHPDGTRIATSVGVMPHDIWILDGFDQP